VNGVSKVYSQDFGLHVEPVSAVLTAPQLERLVAFGTCFVFHLKDLDNFLPSPVGLHAELPRINTNRTTQVQAPGTGERRPIVRNTSRSAELRRHHSSSAGHDPIPNGADNAIPKHGPGKGKRLGKKGGLAKEGSETHLFMEDVQPTSAAGQTEMLSPQQAVEALGGTGTVANYTTVHAHVTHARLYLTVGSSTVCQLVLPSGLTITRDTLIRRTSHQFDNVLADSIVLQLFLRPHGSTDVVYDCLFPVVAGGYDQAGFEVEDWREVGVVSCDATLQHRIRKGSWRKDALAQIRFLKTSDVQHRIHFLWPRPGRPASAMPGSARKQDSTRFLHPSLLHQQSSANLMDSPTGESTVPRAQTGQWLEEMERYHAMNGIQEEEEGCRNIGTRYAAPVLTSSSSSSEIPSESEEEEEEGRGEEEEEALSEETAIDTVTTGRHSASPSTADWSSVPRKIDRSGRGALQVVGRGLVPQAATAATGQNLQEEEVFSSTSSSDRSGREQTPSSRQTQYDSAELEELNSLSVASDSGESFASAATHLRQGSKTSTATDDLLAGGHNAGGSQVPLPAGTLVLSTSESSSDSDPVVEIAGYESDHSGVGKEVVAQAARPIVLQPSRKRQASLPVGQAQHDADVDFHADRQAERQARRSQKPKHRPTGAGNIPAGDHSFPPPSHSPIQEVGVPMHTAERRARDVRAEFQAKRSKSVSSRGSSRASSPGFRRLSSLPAGLPEWAPVSAFAEALRSQDSIKRMQQQKEDGDGLTFAEFIPSYSVMEHLMSTTTEKEAESAERQPTVPVFATKGLVGVVPGIVPFHVAKNGDDTNSVFAPATESDAASLLDLGPEEECVDVVISTSGPVEVFLTPLTAQVVQRLQQDLNTNGTHGEEPAFDTMLDSMQKHYMADILHTHVSSSTSRMRLRLHCHSVGIRLLQDGVLADTAIQPVMDENGNNSQQDIHLRGVSLALLRIEGLSITLAKHSRYEKTEQLYNAEVPRIQTFLSRCTGVFKINGIQLQMRATSGIVPEQLGISKKRQSVRFCPSQLEHDFLTVVSELKVDGVRLTADFSQDADRVGKATSLLSVGAIDGQACSAMSDVVCGASFAWLRCLSSIGAVFQETTRRRHHDIELLIGLLLDEIAIAPSPGNFRQTDPLWAETADDMTSDRNWNLLMTFRSHLKRAQSGEDLFWAKVGGMHYIPVFQFYPDPQLPWLLSGIRVLVLFCALNHSLHNTSAFPDMRRQLGLHSPLLMCVQISLTYCAPRPGSQGSQREAAQDFPCGCHGLVANGSAGSEVVRQRRRRRSRQRPA